MRLLSLGSLNPMVEAVVGSMKRESMPCTSWLWDTGKEPAPSVCFFI
jgi:hypothetical protein